MLTHCFDFLSKIISRDTLFAIKMPTPFGEHLIFNMEGCGARASVFHDGANGVFFFAVTRVCIGHDWQP